MGSDRWIRWRRIEPEIEYLRARHRPPRRVPNEPGWRRRMW